MCQVATKDLISSEYGSFHETKLSHTGRFCFGSVVASSAGQMHSRVLICEGFLPKLLGPRS